MVRTDEDVAAELMPAGLRFVERDRTEIRLPTQAANLAPGCSPAHGRIDAAAGEIGRVDDSDSVHRLNGGWFRLATELGLFGEDRQFLLEVDYSDSIDEPELAWVRVQLLDKWDLAGSGVPALGRRSMEFTALALDERVLMRSTLWGDGTTSSLAVPDPATVPLIRNYAEMMTENPFYSADVQDAARRWLAAH